MGNAPRIYTLTNDQDAARFGLSPRERDIVLSRRFTDRQGKRAAAIFWHIQDGTTVGSLDWWTVHEASSTYLLNRDGSLVSCIPEQHGPWTNGAVRNPTAKWQAFAREHPGNPNLYTISIEMEGRPFGGITEAQLETAVWLGRDLMDRYALGLDDHYRHADVDSVQRPNCPGPYFDQLMGRLRSGAGKPAGYGTIVGFRAPVLVTVTAAAGLNVRRWGDLDAEVLGLDGRGTQFWAEGYVLGDTVDGENRWYIEASTRHPRRWAGGTDKAGLG